ncbi:MAG: FAD-dependent oxidoreductase [Ruminococcaceae bacterium]|nr:FAD-dependent oxidoreductase [Oscillospiraceae bacterium]
MFDIIVIGGGPAGLTAAVYARRAGKSVLVIEKETFGGQITFSPKVENIPGFASISGAAFAEKLTEQAMEQGVEFECCEAKEIVDGNPKKVVTDEGTFEGKAVIVATGARHRLLGIPDEEKYIGDGISFCAVCDGAFYKGQTVAVIGGGNSALQEALLLSETSEKVYVLQNLAFFTGEQVLVSQLEEKENVEVRFETVVEEILDEDGFAGIRIRNTAKDTTEEIRADGMFVAIGLVPQNEPFRNMILLNEYGYADMDESCIGNTPGVFAAGDCRSKRIRQVTTATADGATAALAACAYIDSL